MFQINASDHGTPNRSVSTTVRVQVEDENDNTPYITKGNYIVTNISEVYTHKKTDFNIDI
jgi:hypothetical protein